MKQFLILLLSSLIPALTSCYKTIEKMDNSANEAVLSYPAANQFNLASSGLNFWNEALISPDMGDETDTLTFSLNIPYAATRAITITVGIDEKAAEAYNRNPVDSTRYVLMPADYYSLAESEITLPAGVTDTSFKVAIRPSLFDISNTGYLLPVSITSANGITVSRMNTAYIHIEKDPFPPYSRSNWTVAGFDSQEEVGEGPDNGRVKNLFDNDNNTFWHTQWKDGQPGLPHWFAVDMQAAYVLHGILFLDRQGVGSAGRPKEVKVEVSSDNATWTAAGTFKLADDNGKWQKITFANPTEASRYFKVTVSSTYTDTYYTNLAEIKAF